MSAIDNETRIVHIREAAEKVIQYTTDKTQADFEKDEILQLAIIRLIEIIGEAAARLSPEFREKYSSIPWQAIIGMRNRLVYAYFSIDYDVVWLTITSAIPDLLKQITNMDDFSDTKNE